MNQGAFLKAQSLPKERRAAWASWRRNSPADIHFWIERNAKAKTTNLIVQ